MMENRERLMTVDDMAGYLRFTKARVYALINGNQVPVHRVGGQWRFLKSEIEEWLEQQVLQDTTESAEHGSKNCVKMI